MKDKTPLDSKKDIKQVRRRLTEGKTLAARQKEEAPVAR